MVIAAALCAAPGVAQDRLPGTAPFADFRGVVDVVVVSAADQIDSQALRRAAEKRLQNHGLLVEWADTTVQPRLVIEIVAEHHTPSGGAITHHMYDLEVSFREPVFAERSPEALFIGTTWSSHSRTMKFGADVDGRALVESVLGGVNAFIRHVLTQRETAR